jgi:hypothetical protein
MVSEPDSSVSRIKALLFIGSVTMGEPLSLCKPQCTCIENWDTADY